jgi:hypothetical protein
MRCSLGKQDLAGVAIRLIDRLRLHGSAMSPQHRRRSFEIPRRCLTDRAEIIRSGDNGLEAHLQTAQALARRFDAVLVGMHVMPPPFIPIADGEAVAYVLPELIEAQRKVNQEVKERVGAAFQRICGTTVWQETEGDPERLLAEAARTADLVLAAKGDEGMKGSQIVEQLAMAAGVPVLMLPPEASEAMGTSIIAGWNGSREAARALHDALPFLCGLPPVPARAGHFPSVGIIRSHENALRQVNSAQRIKKLSSDATHRLKRLASHVSRDDMLRACFPAAQSFDSFQHRWVSC